VIGVDAAGLENPEIYAKFDHSRRPIHAILFQSDCLIIENLVNLAALPDHSVELIWLPLKIKGGTGGMARVVAICDQPPVDVSDLSPLVTIIAHLTDTEKVILRAVWNLQCQNTPPSKAAVLARCPETKRRLWREQLESLYRRAILVKTRDAVPCYTLDDELGRVLAEALSW
jgi:hypothetical protein